MKLAIVVVEDEPEVRDAVLGDLAPFADTVRIEPAEDVDDALEVVDEILGGGSEEIVDEIRDRLHLRAHLEEIPDE